MLSIQKIPLGAEDAAKYYTQKIAKEDYYLQGQEPPGQWYGGEEFGLSGEVHIADLEALFKGQSPDGDQLVKLAGKNSQHAPGWDCTFSAPKSVSLAFARADLQLREKILDAHDRAVEAALSHTERVVLRESVRRVRMENGVRVVDREAPQSIIAARFQHRTSRELDPQLHTHCLIMNMAKRQDNTWGGLELKQLFKEKKAVGAIYRSELASILQKELGFRVEKDREFFRLKYVPKEAEKAFSKRREQILSAMNKRGWAGGRLAKEASLLTREKKRLVDNDAMMEIWKIQCDKMGWDYGKFQEKFTEKDKTAYYDCWKDKTIDATREEIADKALSEITAKYSTCTIEGLKSKFCEHSQGLLNASEIETEFSKYRSFKNLVDLGLDEFGRNIFTTAQIREIEPKMLSTAAELNASQEKGIASDKQADLILDFENNMQKTMSGFQFSSDQVDAILHAFSAGQIKVIEGVAGAGKSLSMQLVREAFEKEGYNVRGLCPTGTAADNLSESGISTMTMDKYFVGKKHGRDKLTSRDVVVCDEMGMVGSKKTARLLEEVKRAGAKVLLVGESGQLQPLDAGGAFRALGKSLGKATISKIFRQEENWQKEAVAHFRAGEAEKALFLYHQRGLLKLESSPSKINTKLVSDFVSQKLEKPGESSLILARTNEEVSALNQAIREQLKDKGLLSKESDRQASVRVNKKNEERSFAVGDRVIFLKNNTKLKVKNGTLGTITEISPDMRGHARFVHAVNDKGVSIKIDLFNYNYLDHAYAVTVYKSQGSTIDRVFVRATPNMDRETSYVAMSRQKVKASLYATYEDFGEKIDKMEPLINLCNKETRAQLMADKCIANLGKIMNRSVQKNTSVDHEIPDPIPVVTAKLKKMAQDLKPEFSERQLSLLKEIALSPGGLLKKGDDPTLVTPWRQQALDILSRSEFEKISKLRDEINSYQTGSDPEPTDKLRTQISFWKRDVDSLYASQRNLFQDYQKEYVTQKVVETSRVLYSALSAEERIRALNEIAAAPRGVGLDRQVNWNPAPAAYQLRARNLVRNGNLGKTASQELSEHIQSLPVGREPSLDHDKMQALEKVISRRMAVMQKDTELGRQVYRNKSKEQSI